MVFCQPLPDFLAHDPGATKRSSHVSNTETRPAFLLPEERELEWGQSGGGSERLGLCTNVAACARTQLDLRRCCLGGPGNGSAAGGWFERPPNLRSAIRSHPGLSSYNRAVSPPWQ
jgi:hypothetical protein